MKVYIRKNQHLRSYNLEITCRHVAHLGVLTFVLKHGVIFCLCVSFFFNIYVLFIWLCQVLVVAHRIFIASSGIFCFIT